ncbi:LPS-assembly protein LptD [Kushneria pakistanensis]|uniref:LPS-assembly protein LptD n=1 Tax=Kushneria pakistanensis TaxID=1508770 RepID=A0ABQ3FB08_9GAMM|nr:LPS-assembly protein LptD [Kushneria pakistanensis]GHC16417.1 LPS-assembly protein LptD [Kushneria pakistanensis]
MGQRIFWTAASLTGLLSTMAQAAPQPLPASELDWQAWGDDRPANALCRGRYIMPDYRIDAGSNPSQVRTESDDAGYGSNGETLLDGEVVLRRGDQQLEAQRATLNEARTNVSLQGPVAYRQPGFLVRGDQGQVALNSDAAEIDQAHYVAHQQRLRGDAGQLARLEDGRYRLRDASFTTCEPQSSLWKLVSSDITLDQERGYGTATHARMEIEDVPVFYWPWVRFPIDDRRLTGFLWPSISYGSEAGLDYAQPFYLNLSPNYDATITPRYISGRGEALGGQLRYLFDEDAGTLEGNYLGHDNGGDDNDFKGEDRWFVRYAHDGRFSPRTTYNLRYGGASDGDYFDDFGQTFEEQDTDNLERLARLNYQGTTWNLQARARGYQKLDEPLRDDDKPFYELPALLASARWDQAGGFYEEFNSSATYFWRDVNYSDSSIIPQESATGARVHMAPAVGFRRSPSWGFFEPRAQLMATQYDLDWHGRNDTSGFDDSPNRVLPVLSVDSGLIFERDTSMFGRDWRQTLEPRLYYAYAPYRDQSELPQFDSREQPLSYSQLWSPYRFSGSDRIGDTNKVSYGVSTRFLEDDTGRERLGLSVGQSHYFEDRRVVDARFEDRIINEQSDLFYRNTRDRSPIVAEADWQISDRWSARQSFFYDDHRNRTEKTSSYLTYQDTDNLILNLGYRWTVQDFDPFGDQDDRLTYNREEYDVSAAYRLTPAISLLGRYLYDQTNNRTLETLAGVRFDDCCYGVQLAWREYIDDNSTARIDDDDRKHGLFLSFIFKGLGGVGQGSSDGYFSQAIPGVRENDFGAYTGVSN